MKFVVSIKMLLFVMSAHSFKCIFYFLIMRTVFNTKLTENLNEYFIRLLNLTYRENASISIVDRIDWATVKPVAQIQITSDILLHFSCFPFIMWLSNSAWVFSIFNDFMLWICFLCHMYRSMYNVHITRCVNCNKYMSIEHYPIVWARRMKCCWNENFRFRCNRTISCERVAFHRSCFQNDS